MSAVNFDKWFIAKKKLKTWKKIALWILCKMMKIWNKAKIHKSPQIATFFWKLKTLWKSIETSFWRCFHIILTIFFKITWNSNLCKKNGIFKYIYLKKTPLNWIKEPKCSLRKMTFWMRYLLHQTWIQCKLFNHSTSWKMSLLKHLWLDKIIIWRKI